MAIQPKTIYHWRPRKKKVPRLVIITPKQAIKPQMIFAPDGPEGWLSSLKLSSIWHNCLSRLFMILRARAIVYNIAAVPKPIVSSGRPTPYRTCGSKPQLFVSTTLATVASFPNNEIAINIAPKITDGHWNCVLLWCIHKSISAEYPESLELWGSTFSMFTASTRI